MRTRAPKRATLVPKSRLRRGRAASVHPSTLGAVMGPARMGRFIIIVVVRGEVDGRHHPVGQHASALKSVPLRYPA